MTRLRDSACMLLLGASILWACSDRRAVPHVDEIDAGALVAAAAEQPDSTRDAIMRALHLASTAETDSARAHHLAAAKSRARAYAVAWSDSFFVRRVAHFEEASAARRRGIVLADSLRDAGRLAAGQEGIPAAQRLWRESLRRADAVDDSAGRAAALYSIGAGFYLAHELDSAAVHLDRALELARAIGDNRTIGNAIGVLASVAKDRNELTRAASLYEEALSIRPRSGDTRGVAADENNLGMVAWALGDLARARQAFERARELNRAHGRDRPAALNLENLGDVASIGGDYAAAQSFYEQALELNRAAGDIAETGFALHRLALLAMRRGDYPRALTSLGEALAIHERAGAMHEALSVRSDLAAVQAATGDLESALATIDRALADAAAVASPGATYTAESAAALALQARLALTSGDLAVQLGTFADADAAYGRAERLSRESGDAAGQAEAQAGRAHLQLLRENHAEALRLLDLAARAQANVGDTRSVALTQMLMADVRREMGDTAAARELLTSARETAVRLGDVGAETAVLAMLGDLALARGAPVAAESVYRTGLDRLGVRHIPDVRWRLHAGLAEALRTRGALDAAAMELHAGIAAIEDVAVGLQREERRAGFLSDKWQVYSALARVEQLRGRAADGFAISERMRAQQLLAMLERGRVSTRSESRNREQDLRRRINELTREIGAHHERVDVTREPALAARTLDVAREALDAAQKEYGALLDDMRAAEPGYARLASAEPVGWQAAADRLEPDQAMLEFLLTDSASTAFVLTADTVLAIDLDVGRRQIADLVDFARRALDRPDSPATGSLWRSPLARLYNLLIGPVARSGLLDDKRQLVIVPHAELHFLPFGALLEMPAERFLAERYRITYAPSASLWVHLGGRGGGWRRSGVLALAPFTTRLPASAEEIRGIRASFGRSRTTVLSGAAASERALLAAAPHHGILHLATYGVLNKHNPLFSYVELAPGGGDGRLEVHEVLDIELDGQLIVLSACQTAVGSGALADVPPGDDWVGLMQAFLQAGAGGVLASLWPVDDRATARLMQRFYSELARGIPESEAFARAQRSMLREPGTAHPFYWAGFVLNGTKSS